MTVETFVIKRKTSGTPKTYIVKNYIDIFRDEDYTYSKTSDTITISKYNGNDENVSIINDTLYTYLPKLMK